MSPADGLDYAVKSKQFTSILTWTFGASPCEDYTRGLSEASSLLNDSVIGSDPTLNPVDR
jgi:hypothetical protein